MSWMAWNVTDQYVIVSTDGKIFHKIPLDAVICKVTWDRIDSLEQQLYENQVSKEEQKELRTRIDENKKLEKIVNCGEADE